MLPRRKPELAGAGLLRRTPEVENQPFRCTPATAGRRYMDFGLCGARVASWAGLLRRTPEVENQPLRCTPATAGRRYMDLGLCGARVASWAGLLRRTPEVENRPLRCTPATAGRRYMDFGLRSAPAFSWAGSRKRGGFGWPAPSSPRLGESPGLRVFAALLALLTLAGCAALEPRPRQMDLAIPGAYEAAASASALEDGEAAEPVAEEWWRSFGLPELDAAVEEALEHNRDLEGAAARLAQAEARARIAGANRQPQVSAGFNGSRSRRNFIGFPIPGSGSQVLSSTSTSLGVSLDTSWEVDLWGRLKAGQGAALADAEALRWQWQAARLSLAGQVVKTWSAAAEARQQVELAQAVLESRRDTAAKVRRRYEAGLRPALDLRLALANEAGAEAQLAARQQQEEAVRRQLEILLGRYPAGALRPSDLPAFLEPLGPGLPAELVTRRPDLLALERSVAVAGLRVREARGALFPQLRLTGSGGTVSQQLEDLLDGDFRVWSLAAGLLQPIFQGGRLRAAVDLAEGSADEALARYAQGVLVAFGEVENALAGERWLRQQLQALAAATQQAEAAGRLAEERYEAGLGDYLEVLESQRGAFDAHSRLLEARRLVFSQRVDLLLALGGGLPDTATVPAAVPATAPATVPVAQSLPTFGNPSETAPGRNIGQDPCSAGPPWPACTAREESPSQGQPAAIPAGQSFLDLRNPPGRNIGQDPCSAGPPWPACTAREESPALGQPAAIPAGRSFLDLRNPPGRNIGRDPCSAGPPWPACTAKAEISSSGYAAKAWPGTRPRAAVGADPAPEKEIGDA